MNKKYFLILLILIFLISTIFAITQPIIHSPNATGIKIYNETTINWSASFGSGEPIKYNLFYSNNSGTNWYKIVYDWGYTNSLNNSNTEENFTFSGAENKTIHVTIPKVANITSAKLNLTGYVFVTTPYSRVYNSLVDEPESDGSATNSYQAVGFGTVSTGRPINMYFLINNTPEVNADMLGILLGPGSSNPQNNEIVYDVHIAEGDFLVGNPIDDNTTAYTKVKSDLRCSEEWGNAQNEYKNISFDTSYYLNSSKKYIVWFEHISSNLSDGGSYAVKFDSDSGASYNYTGVREPRTNTSYARIPGIEFYNGTRGNSSNVWLEVGEKDSDQEWNQTGEFTTTNTTKDFNNTLQSYIDNTCASDISENCTIPLFLHSDSVGKIQVSSIDIQFTGYWWNTTNLNELTTYLVNITPTNNSINGTSITSGNDFTIARQGPNISLISPSKDYSNSSASEIDISFNCSGTDDFGLTNISLYITNNQNTSFSFNQSTAVSGNTSANWTLTLTTGTYTWNCLTYDNATNFKWGENQTIILNYSAPSSGAPSGGSARTSSFKEKIEFDVKILEIDPPKESGDFFNFIYYVKGVGRINSDVLIEFWIEKDLQPILTGSDIIYFSENEEKTEATSLLIPSTIINDTYLFYVKASYANYAARAHRVIEVLPKSETEKEIVFSPEKPSFWNKIKSFFSKALKYLNSNKLFLWIGLGILIAVLFLVIILIIKKHKKEKEQDRLKSVIKLEVYSADGNKIGKVKEIYLTKNKIKHLLIKPDKKIFKKIRKKKILIKNKNIRSIGNIVIVDKRVKDFLKK